MQLWGDKSGQQEFKARLYDIVRVLRRLLPICSLGGRLRRVVGEKMSYTQRRYFAHAEQRRREDAEPSPDTPPPDMMLAHSFRASWGPGGTLVFGSRSVRMVQVAPPDAAAGNGGDAESTRQRATATLGVEREAKRFAAGGDTPPLAALAHQHKLATATAASSQAALQEAHAWKLMSALLDRAAHRAGGSAMSEAGEALENVRQREAVCAWLRLSMWDTAAQELQEGGSAAARVWSLATSLHATEATRSALAGEDGGDAGGRAYLAAMLASPVSEVQADMRQQLAHWRQHGAAGAAPPPPHAEEAAALLPRLFELLAGETAAAEADLSRDGRGTCGWPQGTPPPPRPNPTAASATASAIVPAPDPAPHP